MDCRGEQINCSIIAIQADWFQSLEQSVVVEGVVFAIFELDYLLNIRATVFLHAFWEMAKYLVQEKAGSTNINDSGFNDTIKILIELFSFSNSSL
nr:hypothetical protein [Tanacetum cinerariifolium]